MTSQERAKVYAQLPATIIIRIGNFYMLVCQGVMRFVPATRQPR